MAAAGDELSALRTELGRMHILDDLGRPAEAVTVGNALLQALAAARTAGNAELLGLLGARALNNLGAAHSLLGAHEEALESYARSAAAYRRIGMDDATAEPRANRGIELLALGRPREALTALVQRRAVLRRRRRPALGGQVQRVPRPGVRATGSAG